MLRTCLLVFLASCGAAPPPTALDEEVVDEGRVVEGADTAHREAPPSSALELVELLSAITTGARPGRLGDHVDRDFARLLPSTSDLASLFGREEEGCVPVLREGPGYVAIAIPPPMEGDPEDEIRRAEAIIEVLQASTEVFASCTMTRTIAGAEGEPDETFQEQVPLWAIAVRRAEDGAFVALAWRRFDDEPRGGH